MGRAKPAAGGEPSPPARSEKRPILAFGLRFALALALFEAFFIVVLADSGPFETYLELNARGATGILELFGEEMTRRGTLLKSVAGSVDVRKGCDAIQPAGLFAIAVLVFPVPLRSRLLALGWGVPTLLLLNLVRIVTLYWTAVHAPDQFENAHLGYWQFGFILFAMVLWIAWAQAVLKPPA